MEFLSNIVPKLWNGEKIIPQAIPNGVGSVRNEARAQEACAPLSQKEDRAADEKHNQAVVLLELLEEFPSERKS